MNSQLYKISILTLTMALLFVSFSFTALAEEAVAPDLGSASPFGLMGVSISNTNPTFVAGSIGSDGQTSAPTITIGANFLNDDTYHTANIDLGLAIDSANDQSCTFTGEAGADIGGETFQAGVHCYPGAVNVTGTVALDGPGVFIFKIDGAFNTAANAVFELTNGAKAANVYYVVAGASTLGANTTFIGTLMSKAAITVDTSNIVGRMLSQPAVTISTSTITVPQDIQQQDLVVSAICTEQPEVDRGWNVINPNDTEISFIYEIEGTAQTESQTIAANNEVQITTTAEGTNVMNILVDGAVQSVITNTGEPCTEPVQEPVQEPAAEQEPDPEEDPISEEDPEQAACLQAAAIVTAIEEIPAGSTLISKDTSALTVWLLADGNLMVKADIEDQSNVTGFWSFDLGGQMYTVDGSDNITYTIVDPPVGTYSAAATFTSDCDETVVDLLAETITVPTVTGGTLPDTSTPWYNILLLGAIMLIAGTMIMIKRKLRD